MFKNLSYKKKVRYLLIGFLLLILLSYNLSIKETLTKVSECNELEEKLLLVDDAPNRINLLQSKLQVINEKIGASIASDIDFQELLLEKVSKYCNDNKLVLKEMLQTHSYKNQDFEVETNLAVVEGPFIKLLLLVYSLETDFNLGKVASVEFVSKKDFKTNRLRLTAAIYFQNVKNSKR